jgi:hypothetical protein
VPTNSPACGSTNSAFEGDMFQLLDKFSSREQVPASDGCMPANCMFRNTIQLLFEFILLV